jgi:uncharacterized protein (TIGR03437 family)
MHSCAHRRILCKSIFIVALAAIFGSSLTNVGKGDAASVTPGVLSTAQPKLPNALKTVFEPNVGQSQPEVRFLSRGNSTMTFLTVSEAVIVPASDYSVGQAAGGAEEAPLRIRWLDANPDPEMEGVSLQRSRSNYLIGEDPQHWQTQVANYAEVRYKNLYSGIDLIYKTAYPDFEYDFIVGPHADPNVIKLQFQGQRDLQIDADGALLLELGSGRMTQLRPTVFQEIHGHREFVQAAYSEQGPGIFGFALGEYDRSLPLVIDPVLTFSSYLGGRRNEIANGVAVDAGGNMYLIGTTTSPDFPTVQALQPAYHETFSDPLGACHPFDSPFRTPCPDAFVVKLDPSGALVYSTYIGGNSWDQGMSIAADAAGNAYLTGSTEGGFPLANAFQNTFGGRRPSEAIVGDAFVAKLDSSGSRLIYSTYLGGSFDDLGAAIRVDGGGSAAVAGWTSSWNFPVRNPLQSENKITNPVVGSNAFVAKFDSAGGLEWSTFLGGSGVVADKATSVALHRDGSIYVAGQAASSDFPTTANALQRTNAGGVDAFVAKINAAGTNLTYSSYLGGARNDVANAVAVDETGNAYIVGATNSANFPAVNAMQSTLATGDCNGSPCDDAFLAELNPAGSTLVFSTYLGGSGADAATGIATDSSGAIIATGRTSSPNFPITPGSPRFAGVSDAFLVKRQSSTLVYTSYFGGAGADFATSMALDASGNVYLAGGTSSSDLPTAGAFQTRLGGGVGDFGVPSGDAFIAKFADHEDRTSGPGAVAVFDNGTVNGASFATGAAVAPGSIASAFGTNLGVNFAAQFVPLPTTLGDSSADIGGFFAPLFFTSAGQINLQVPWELQGQTQAMISVFTGGTWSEQRLVRLEAFAPGIFTVGQNGGGQGAVLIANTAELAAPSGSMSGVIARAATRGSAVSIFCTGLGPVSNPPPSGWPALANPVSVTQTLPVVIFGGVGGRLLFSGLAPGFVGLYQVNVEVPADAPTGDAVPLQLSIAGVSSNTVTVAIN